MIQVSDLDQQQSRWRAWLDRWEAQKVRKWSFFRSERKQSRATDGKVERRRIHYSNWLFFQTLYSCRQQQAIHACCLPSSLSISWWATIQCLSVYGHYRHWSEWGSLSTVGWSVYGNNIPIIHCAVVSHAEMTSDMNMVRKEIDFQEDGDIEEETSTILPGTQSDKYFVSSKSRTYIHAYLDIMNIKAWLECQCPKLGLAIKRRRNVETEI